ncbi:UNVERIFIED_CONTAM: RNA polymerase II transcription factor B 52 kDa subunit, partial [Siphonaria sp. JEL0065]
MATILEHIEKKLDRNTQTRLYQQPATCLAVLRLLQPLAKHVVMRLLFVSAVEMVVVSAWIFDKQQTTLLEALESLFKFNIAWNENGVLKINSVFQANLKNALVGGGNTSSFGLPTDSKDKKDITTDYLDLYAKESWETVLHFLVGTPSDKRPSAVVALMEGSGLMARGSRNSDELRITNKGFQFLLQDVNEQVWGFLLQYLEMAEPNMGMDPVDVLNFFFQLGSLEFGQDYAVDVLTDTQKQMLDDLKHFGLVYQRKKKSSRFYPTRLATSLTSGAASSGDTGDSGYIIVETNFKVYAYTTSPLQIAVLSLFLSLKARFSNMVIGVLTRDSVRQAYDNGISAHQIAQFLTNHAHPEMKKQLPPTVVDQIRLWESERKRAVAMPAHLYQEFARESDFKEAYAFAKFDFYFCV